MLLNDGTNIPFIAFGTGTAHYKKEASDIVRTAINSGFTHLDTADNYENEGSLGEAWKSSGKPREELYIVTKLPGSLGPGETVRSSLITSLKKLNTHYVDLYLVHSPRTASFSKTTLGKLWKEMEAVKAEGLARSIGVSNYFAEDLEETLKECTVVPAVNQIEFHPYILKASEDILRICRDNKIIVASYGAMTPVTRHVGGPVDTVVDGIIQRMGGSVTASQILVKWVLQKGAIVITTSTKEERIKEYLATEQVPDLTGEEIAAIDEAGHKAPTAPRILAYYQKLNSEGQLV